MKNLIYKYLVYIIYFLGIGMTSSGIVLMPFNVMRYSIILLNFNYMLNSRIIYSTKLLSTLIIFITWFNDLTM